MADDEIQFIEAQFQHVSLLPGDVLVFSFPGRVCDKVHAQLARVVAELFPGHEALILEDGGKVGVLARGGGQEPGQ